MVKSYLHQRTIALVKKNAAFSQMAKQYWTGKLTKPTQKDKQVQITFDKNDEEYSPDKTHSNHFVGQIINLDDLN